MWEINKIAFWSQHWLSLYDLKVSDHFYKIKFIFAFISEWPYFPKWKGWWRMWQTGCLAWGWKNPNPFPLLIRPGVALSLLIPPTPGISSCSNSVLQPHWNSFTSYRTSPCSSSPVLHIVILSPFLPPHLLHPPNYLSFTRSQLKSCLPQEDLHQASKFTSCILQVVK